MIKEARPVHNPDVIAKVAAGKVLGDPLETERGPTLPMAPVSSGTKTGTGTG